uniref:Uncharacterized protein n=1 Tax=Glossina morsitans morsitans TaxID=37546 RepID=A0ABK9NG96_GLOMM
MLTFEGMVNTLHYINGPKRFLKYDKKISECREIFSRQSFKKKCCRSRKRCEI